MSDLSQFSVGVTGGVDVIGVEIGGVGVGVRIFGGLTDMTTGSVDASSRVDLDVLSCKCMMAFVC